METLRNLRNKLTLYPNEVGSSIRYFFKNNIDWDVYLPSIKMNLQRDFVWSLEQKQELIYSILIGRHISHCAVINIVDKNDSSKEIWQIIDGKQRLSAIKSFLEDLFYITLEGKDYLFSMLPEDYQKGITHSYIRYYVVNEEWGKPVTDQEKITWFKFINFSGTPQDKEHLDKLK